MGSVLSTNPLQGSYGLTVTTGALATPLAAGTDTAGHLAYFRWSSATKTCHIQRVRAIWQTTTGFVAAQALGMDLVHLHTFTADPTGTTKVVGSAAAVGNGFKRWTKEADSSVGCVFIAATGEITPVGTFTSINTLGLDTLAQGWGYAAAAATQTDGSFALDRDFTLNGEAGLRLETNEGLLLRNTVALGAGGVARVTFMVDWFEAPV
jgi:hypothetical protein